MFKMLNAIFMPLKNLILAFSVGCCFFIAFPDLLTFFLISIFLYICYLCFGGPGVVFIILLGIVTGVMIIIKEKKEYAELRRQSDLVGAERKAEAKKRKGYQFTLFDLM